MASRASQPGAVDDLLALGELHAVGERGARGVAQRLSGPLSGARDGMTSRLPI